MAAGVIEIKTRKRPAGPRLDLSLAPSNLNGKGLSMVWGRVAVAEETE